MKFFHMSLQRVATVWLMFSCITSVALSMVVQPCLAAAEQPYDIIYILSKDLGRVLDYKEDLEGIFDVTVQRKLNVVGRGDEYALIYDANDTAATVAKTLIRHAEILGKAGYDEPWAIKDQDFHSLYNVSYGIGPNLEPLKKRYEIIYKTLGDDVKSDLFIEQTAYGNYVLVYRRRGDQASTARVAARHAKILRSKRIKTSLTKESNNTVVYGESSLIDDATGQAPAVAVASEPKTEPVAQASPAPAEEKAAKEEPEVIKARTIVKNEVDTKPDVVSAIESRFERSIEEYIALMRQKGRIENDELTGWMVYDLERDKSLVDINAEQAFQAASMIKPFVALAFFHQVREGKFGYGKRSRRNLEAMIQRSSNSSTNWVMRQAGGPQACNEILKKYYSKIFKNTEIKEYIPANGRTYLNSAPPADYVRFLRALWNQELPYGKEIRRLMALPGRDRLYYGTPIPRGTLVYNKTGSTAHLCGDMGILVPKTKNGGRHPYAIVGIIERRSRAENYGSWMNSRSKVIREVSTLVYEELKKEYKLM